MAEARWKHLWPGWVVTSMVIGVSKIGHEERSLERYGNVSYHLQLALILRKRPIRQPFPNQCTDSSLARLQTDCRAPRHRGMAHISQIASNPVSSFNLQQKQKLSRFPSFVGLIAVSVINILCSCTYLPKPPVRDESKVRHQRRWDAHLLPYGWVDPWQRHELTGEHSTGD